MHVSAYLHTVQQRFFKTTCCHDQTSRIMNHSYSWLTQAPVRFTSIPPISINLLCACISDVRLVKPLWMICWIYLLNYSRAHSWQCRDLFTVYVTLRNNLLAYLCTWSKRRYHVTGYDMEFTLLIKKWILLIIYSPSKQVFDKQSWFRIPRWCRPVYGPFWIKVLGGFYMEYYGNLSLLRSAQWFAVQQLIKFQSKASSLKSW